MAESTVSGVSGLGRVPTELAGEQKGRAPGQPSTNERRLTDSGATIIAAEDRFTTGEEPPAQIDPEEQLRRLLERSHVRQEAQLLAAADMPIKSDE
jgi:hypothetical protein